MSIEIKVPELPESITEATLVNWHKKPGEAVARDENLVDLETDKVVLEVPAPADGVLREIKAEDGATVAAGQLLAILDEGAGAGKSVRRGREKKRPSPPSRRKNAADRRSKRARRCRFRLRCAGWSRSTISIPRASRLPAAMDGSPSPMCWVFSNAARTRKPRRRVRSRRPRNRLPRRRPAAGAREERRVPMSRIRARIAERMLESQATTAMLTSFNEVDMSCGDGHPQALQGGFREAAWRAARLPVVLRQGGGACAAKTIPVVNASVEDGDIVYHDYWDIGVAVSTERGLVVPVMRDADRLSFAEIEAKVVEYAGKAREGGLALEDITGGTFTITNGGVFGSLLSTPIINPPQSAILGMHKIQERPMAVDGEVKIRPMMYIALTYDHRIVDGRDAVLFLVAIKEALEDPRAS